MRPHDMKYIVLNIKGKINKIAIKKSISIFFRSTRIIKFISDSISDELEEKILIINIYLCNRTGICFSVVKEIQCNFEW